MYIFWVTNTGMGKEFIAAETPQRAAEIAKEEGLVRDVWNANCEDFSRLFVNRPSKEGMLGYRDMEALKKHDGYLPLMEDGTFKIVS